ncbi:MAG: hypothetical protein ACYS5V_02745, partial [Planctomycetota bacterium]
MNEQEQLWLERGVHALVCDGPDEADRRKLLLRIARDAEAREIVEEMISCQRAVRAAIGHEGIEEVIGRSLRRAQAEWITGSAEEPAAAPNAGGASRWLRWPALATLAAAAMVVGAALWHLHLHGLPRTGRDDSAALAAASLSPAEVDRHRRMFESVSEVFEGRTTWVALANGTSDIGLRPAAVDRTHVLLLRLVMSRQGKVVSNADLVMVAGQDARVVVPLADGRSVRYHVASGSEAGPLAVLAKVTGSPAGGPTLG